MNYNIKSVFKILYVSFILTNTTYSGNKLEEPLHTYIITGIDFILKQEYQKADSVFIELTQIRPKHPAGYIYRASVIQAYSVDYDMPIENGIFDSLLTIAKKYTENLKSPWKDYFIAHIDAQMAYAKVETGNWLGGIWKGVTSALKFENIIEQDSNFYEAYAGLGTYYYWSSKKTQFINWFPFVKDSRELGIKLLTKCIHRSTYNRFTALSALISILLDMEDYKSAEIWSSYALKYYPENRIFLWGLATAVQKQHRYKDAVRLYERLLKNIELMNASHPYSEIVCRLNLAKSRLAIGDTASVEEHLLKILSYRNSNFPNYLKKKAEEKFDEANSILNRIKKQKDNAY